MKRTFDPACFDLAERFLQDAPHLAHKADDLAATIQEAIEDWLENEDSNQEIGDARTAEDMKRHAE